MYSSKFVTNLRDFVHFRPEIGAGENVVEVHFIVGVENQRVRAFLGPRPKKSARGGGLISGEVVQQLNNL